MKLMLTSNLQLRANLSLGDNEKIYHLIANPIDL